MYNFVQLIVRSELEALELVLTAWLLYENFNTNKETHELSKKRNAF